MQRPGRTHRLAEAYARLRAPDPAARAQFEAVHGEAEAAGDERACLLCAAGQLLSVATDYADFRGLALWLRRFEQGCAAWASAESAIDRLRIDSAWVTWPSLDHRIAWDDSGPRAAAVRLREALTDGVEMPADERMLHFKMLIDYHSQQHEVETIGRLAALAQEHLHHAQVSPVWHGLWWWLMTLNHEYFGDAGAAREAFERAMAVTAAHDLKRLRFELLCIDMSSALKSDDLARAERISTDLDRLRPSVRAGRVPHGLRAQALFLMRKGELGAALARMDLLLGICADVEVPERDRGAYWVQRSYCLSGLGRHGEAIATLRAIRPQQKGSQGELLQVIETLAEAVEAIDRAPESAQQLVKRAMHEAARLNWTRFLLPLPALASRVAAMALDGGVETEFVTAAIRERRLVPVDRSREDWPWRLRLYGLGKLRIVRDGEPLRRGEAKAPRKPLELLGALVAHGGEAVGSDVLIDALWPSLEANAPRASLEMAVSRLRKLLDVPDAVLVADGAVSLNKALVWCDVAAFEHAVDRAQQPGSFRGAASPHANLDAWAERALSLYRGRLLGDEELDGHLLTLRERLALKFFRLMTDHGACLEACGDWRSAVALYERLLALDMLCEPFYRALMRCQLQLGERSEALRSFRRCRELLSRVLGTQPTAETLALYGTISAGD